MNKYVNICVSISSQNLTDLTAFLTSTYIISPIFPSYFFGGILHGETTSIIAPSLHWASLTSASYSSASWYSRDVLSWKKWWQFTSTTKKSSYFPLNLGCWRGMCVYIIIPMYKLGSIISYKLYTTRGPFFIAHVDATEIRHSLGYITKASRLVKQNTPPKTNIDTQHDDSEIVSPNKHIWLSDYL